MLLGAGAVVPPRPLQRSAPPSALHLAIYSGEERMLDALLARASAEELAAQACSPYYGATYYGATYYGYAHYGATYYGATYYGYAYYGYAHYGYAHYGYAHYGYAYCGFVVAKVAPVLTIAAGAARAERR